MDATSKPPRSARGHNGAANYAAARNPHVPRRAFDPRIPKPGQWIIRIVRLITAYILADILILDADMTLADAQLLANLIVGLPA